MQYIFDTWIVRNVYIYKIITIDEVFQYLNYSNDDSAIS